MNLVIIIVIIVNLLCFHLNYQKRQETKELVEQNNFLKTQQERVIKYKKNIELYKKLNQELLGIELKIEELNSQIQDLENQIVQNEKTIEKLK